MPRKAIAQIEVGSGEISISPFSHILISQGLFGHHEIEVQAPLRSVEGSDQNLLSRSKDLIGKPITINLSSGQYDSSLSQTFRGIITQVSLARLHSGSSEVLIRAQSPTLLLDDGLQCRSFSEKSLADIFQAVLGDYPSNLLESDIHPNFSATLPYVVQYRESNFQFLYRLANLYAEWMFFDGTRLVLGSPASEDPVELLLGRDMSAFDLSMGLSPVNFQLQAYDYVQNDVHESRSGDASISALDPVYGRQAFDESESLFSQAPLAPATVPIRERAELDELVARKRQQQAGDLVHLQGSSEHIMARIGQKIRVSGSKSEDRSAGNEDYGQYRIISISHRIAGDGDYQNRFDALPAEVAMPPLNHMVRQPICEAQPAVVKENHDPDGLGRVRVQFHWQKGQEMTPWIRLVSSHGGGSGGFFVVPEKGDEVIVGFEHNHPDKPFILGSVYHGKAKPSSSWGDSSNNIKAIKTKSGNEILLIDEGGKEAIKIMNKGGENSIILTMDSGGAINISSKNKIAISCKEMSISAEDKLDITTKKMNVTASESFKLMTQTADVDASQTAYFKTAAFTVEASNSSTIKGDTSILLETTTLTAKGTNINVEATSTSKIKGATTEIEASGQGAKIKGTNVNLEADAMLSAKGNASASVESSGVTTVKGSLVQLN